MASVPQSQDRLGFRRTRRGAEWAKCDPSTSIPANESIVVMNWVRCGMGETVSSDYFCGIGPAESGGGERVSIMRTNTDEMMCGVNDGAWLSVDIPIPDDGDHLWTVVVDRDNTLMDVYLDAALVHSVALSRDPDLLDDNLVQLNNSTGGAGSEVSWTCWRGLIQTFANGSTPTQAQIQEALRAMLSPDAPVHANLSGAVGSVYNDWNLGEGVYGSSTITDNGTSSDDLSIQGGLKVEDIRTRAMTPVRTVTQDWYAVSSGYTASTAAQDFGFAVQPVIMRAIVGKHFIAGTNDLYTPGLRGPGGSNYIRLEQRTSNVRFAAVGGGAGAQTQDYNALYYSGPCDTWIVCNGVNWYVYINGQHVATPTVLAGAVDLSGACNAYIKSVTTADSWCCRIAAWNPATVPATLLDEIRACVMNPELDPPSLTNKRVDFPLNATTLATAGATTVANQGTGGGTLTLSAQRSTSCKVMFAQPTST